MPDDATWIEVGKLDWDPANKMPSASAAAGEKIEHEWRCLLDEMLDTIRLRHSANVR